MIRKMAKAAFIFAAAIALTFTLASAATSATVNANSGLRMRYGMGTNYNIITTIPGGASVSVVEKGSEWSKITYGNKTGFVATRYLSFTTVATTSAANDTLSAKRQNIVNAAVAQLGKPYVYGGNGPYGFDCSGLTQYVYKICGYSIERGPSSQLRSLSVSVSKANLLPGDIVFFRDSRYGSGAATHAGIYVGNGQMIHAPNRGQNVKYASINTGYYGKYYIGARRVIN